MDSPKPETFYELHRQLYDKRIEEGSIEEAPWIRQDRGHGNWQYDHAMLAVDPILEALPAATWLTVGDGRYGSEARYIKEHGGKATATDITDVLLKKAVAAGWIDRGEAQNAENLTYAEGSYDFACCKESAHHLPRPYMAVYELLRVARKAVLLIEPSDPFVCDSIWQWPLTHARRLVNRLINGRNGRNDFEPVGNYLYKFSPRDAEKVAMGLGLPAMAFLGINAFHVHGSPSGGARPSGFRSLLRRLTPLLVKVQDVLVKLSLLQPVMYSIVLFREPPSGDLLSGMRRRGYRFMMLPRNPYVSMLLCCLALLVGGCGRDFRQPLTFGSCLSSLTNVAAMAQAPAGRASMVSSYDRSGGNRDWATWTSTGPDGLITLLEAAGPGCIRRIWMTHVQAAEWLFFIDGEGEARLRLTTEQLFGGKFPFIQPLSGISGGGHYSYLPIPYAKSIRVAIRPSALKADLRSYFHVNYETYPSAQAVESYPRLLTEADSNVVTRACEEWRQAALALSNAADACRSSTTVTVPAGGSVEWLNEKSAGKLAAFWVRLEAGEGASPLQSADQLRQILLAFSWDGSEKPSVEVPVGDFFCNAFYARRFASLVVGRVDDRYVCRIPMPFRRSAVARLRNLGPSPVRVELGWRVDRDPPRRDERYFHAAWTAATGQGEPFSLLNVQAAGHYVGCFLSAVGMDGSWNILEGDESFAIDGEALSMHGTGLEDYFNGAWYYTGLFDLPMHGLIEKAPIRTDQYRFHLGDPVAFSKNLAMRYEFGDGNAARGYMSGVAYWYQDRPAAVNSPDMYGKLLQRPADPIEPHAIMAMLFELERAGLQTEAADRCAIYAQRFTRSPYAAVLQLRALDYRGGREDPATKRVYAQVAAMTNSPLLAAQAADLQWFGDTLDGGLLGVHISGQHRLYLDGQLVSEGDSPGSLRVRRVTLSKGTHEWVADITPTRPCSFLSLFLRTHAGDETSAGAWEFADLSATPMAAHAWPYTNLTEWKPFPEGRGQLPNMTLWRFEPNAYAGMQSGKQLLNLWSFYAGEPIYKRIVLRRKFEWPVPGAESARKDVQGGGTSVEENQARSADRTTSGGK